MSVRSEFEEAVIDVPAWQQAQIPTGYLLTEKGVYRQAAEAEDPGKQKPDEKLAGPIWVTSHTRDLQSNGWGAVVRYMDRDGVLHTRPISLARLHEDGTTLAQELAAEGLFIVFGRERRLIEYLGAFHPQKRVKSVSCVGWIDSEDALAYVLPSLVLSREQAEILYQPERYTFNPRKFEPSGTLSDWNAQVAAMCTDHPYLVFALGVAFSAPLLKCARLDSGGFHVSQRSSRGKTTMAQIAASVWGCGADPADAPERSFICRWNTTANGLEALCSAHNDGLLILDELGTCSARGFDSIIYNIFGGQGKTAMDASRNLKKSRSWRIAVLSTGELTVQAKIEEEKSARGGQLLRLIDLNIEGAIISGLQPALTAELLKKNCATTYGVAGTAFVEALVNTTNQPSDLRKIVEALLGQTLADLCDGRTLTPEQRRATKRFALVEVALLLAAKTAVIDITASKAKDSVRFVYEQWLKEASSLQDSDRAIASIRDYILRHKDSRFGSIMGGSDTQIRDRLGYIDNIKKLVYFTPAAFKEACAGLDSSETARELKRRQLLFTNEGDRLNVKVQIGDHFPRLYAVKMEVLND